MMPSLISAPKFFERRDGSGPIFWGEIDKYNWDDVGSSYLPSDMLAVFSPRQQEYRDQIQSVRREV
jgi:dTDP-4-amino-4,6-dideoxygalactose transaminase